MLVIMMMITIVITQTSGACNRQHLPLLCRSGSVIGSFWLERLLHELLEGVHRATDAEGSSGTLAKFKWRDNCNKTRPMWNQSSANVPLYQQNVVSYSRLAAEWLSNPDRDPHVHRCVRPHFHLIRRRLRDVLPFSQVSHDRRRFIVRHTSCIIHSFFKKSLAVATQGDDSTQWDKLREKTRAIIRLIILFLLSATVGFD